jgi:hypothetical protein
LLAFIGMPTNHVFEFLDVVVLCVLGFCWFLMFLFFGYFVFLLVSDFLTARIWVFVGIFGSEYLVF